MILKNPTENELSVQIKGTSYTLPAGETISISEDHGRQWLRLHGFLQVESEEAQIAETVEEETEEKEEVEKTETVEVTEETTIEATEEKEVKKPTRKSGTRTKNK